jgi:hypothetical protein
MTLKEKTAQWLRTNCSLIVLAIGLLLLAINDSWVGFVMYFAAIHYLLAAFIVGFYDDDFLDMDKIKALAKQKQTKIEAKLNQITLLILCVSSIFILVARDHWYLLVVAVATIIFVSIHIIDGLQKIYRERRRLT